jgi:hypothetical protein
MVVEAAGLGRASEPLLTEYEWLAELLTQSSTLFVPMLNELKISKRLCSVA